MLNQTARNEPPSGRFHNRTQRIARRAERDSFRRLIIPALYVFTVLGWAVFLASVLYGVLTGEISTDFAGLAAGPAVMIGLMEIYRLMRGHHHEALEEP